MNFYFIYDGSSVPHEIWHQQRGDHEWDKINEFQTCSLKDNFPILTIQCLYKQKLPDFFESGAKPIVSQRMRELFENTNIKAEFLPIHVLNKAGTPADGGPFWFMHMLEEIDCIDYEKSIYETVTDNPSSTIRYISKLVFREEAIGEKAVFRTRRFPQIFVNEVLKEKILKNKYKAQLTPLDEIRIG